MTAIQELQVLQAQPQPPSPEVLQDPARRLDTPGNIFQQYLSKLEARYNPFIELESPDFSRNFYLRNQAGYSIRVYSSLRDRRTEYLPTFLPYTQLYLQAYINGKNLNHRIQLSNSESVPIIFESSPSFRWDSILRCPTATLPEIKGPTLDALRTYALLPNYHEFRDQVAELNQFTPQDRIIALHYKTLLNSLAEYNLMLNSRLGFSQAVEIAAEDAVYSADNNVIFVNNLHPKQ